MRYDSFVLSCTYVFSWKQFLQIHRFAWNYLNPRRPRYPHPLPFNLSIPPPTRSSVLSFSLTCVCVNPRLSLTDLNSAANCLTRSRSIPKQSINQSINQPTNQSINQSINQYFNINIYKLITWEESSKQCFCSKPDTPGHKCYDQRFINSSCAKSKYQLKLL